MEYIIIRLRDLERVDLGEVVDAEVIFFGEVHRVDWIIGLEALLIELKSEIDRLDFVGLELFNFRMEGFVNSWVKGEVDWDALVMEYAKGSEGFPLESYKPLLETIREIGVRIVGVMPPREEANKVARIGIEAIRDIDDLPVREEDVVKDYPGYRDVLNKLIPREGPMAKLELNKIILAQALKDQVIAARTFEAYRNYGKGVVITGYAHVEYAGSASTRAKSLGLKDFKVLTSRNKRHNDALKELDAFRPYLEADYIASLR